MSSTFGQGVHDQLVRAIGMRQATPTARREENPYHADVKKMVMLLGDEGLFEERKRRAVSGMEKVHNKKMDDKVKFGAKVKELNKLLDFWRWENLQAGVDANSSATMNT